VVYLLEVVASAPGKVILFGEHFVVYGEPAVVMAIDKRAYALAESRKDRRIYINSKNLGISGVFVGESFEAKKGGHEARVKLEPIRNAAQKVLNLAGRKIGVSIEVRSAIPIAVGLGSSAAVVTATATAVSKLLSANLSKKDIFRIAYEAERIVHGTPSGIDPAISTYGGTLLFSQDKDFKPLEVKGDIPLVIGDTGIERSTGEQVAIVRERKKQYPSIFDPIVEAGGKIAHHAIKALKTGNLQQLGKLMNINQALLYAVGVSNESLERLIYAARKAGALGAKLTGGGGGGCIIALSPPNMLKKVAKAIERAGGTAFIARKTNEGARVES
jgi:mevalonate kinase